MSDVDDVRQYVGDGPTDDAILTAIENYGSPAAAAEAMLRITRASILAKPMSASVEGYSYSNASNIEAIDAMIAELSDLQSETGGTIQLTRPDFARPDPYVGDYVDGF